MTWVRYKAALRARADVLPLAEVAARSAADEVYLISPRLYLSEEDAGAPTPDTRAWYVPAVDVDALWCPLCRRTVTRAEHCGPRGSHPDHEPHLYGRPELAVREALALVAEWRTTYDLAPGVDWDIGLTGGKGCRLVLRYAWRPESRWPDAWRSWLARHESRYSLIDSAVATVDVLRWLGARHPSRAGRPEAEGGWSAAIAPGTPLAEWPATTLSRSPADIRAMWLPDPNREPPAGATRLAEDVLDSYRIAEIMDRTPPRRASSHYRGRPWAELLASVGLVTTRSPDPLWLRTPTCPLCGHQRGSIHAPSGMLYCFSSGCEAHGGLSAAVWTPLIGLARAAVAAPATGVERYQYRQRSTPPAVDLLSARARIAEVTEAALLGSRSDPTVLLAATPGAGKSTAVVDVMASRAKAGARYVLAVPTVELAGEVVPRIRAAAWGLRVASLVSRDAQSCYHLDRVRQASRLGWSPGRTVCAHCEMRDSCGYYRARRAAQDAQVVVGPWESAITLAGAGALGPIDALVVDEDPTRALTSTHRLDADDVMRWAGFPGLPGVAGAVEVLLGAMRLAVEAMRDGRRRQRRGAPRSSVTLRGEGLREVLRQSGDAHRLREAAVEAASFSPPLGWLSPRLRDDATRSTPGRPMLDLVGALWSVYDSPERLSPVQLDVTADGGATWLLGLSQRPRRTPRLCLDAYGDPTAYAQLLGAPIQHERIEVATGSRYWWVPTPSSRRAIARDPAPLYEAARSVEHALSDLRGGDTWRGLLVSHLSEIRHLREDEAARAGSQINGRPTPWALRHYYAGAGTNAYEDLEVALCLGTPRHPPDQVQMLGAILHRGEAEWTGPDDERLTRIEEHLREAELAQSAHRVRPIRGGRDVVLVTDSDCSLLPRPRRLSAGGLVLLGQAVRALRTHRRWSTADADLTELGRTDDRTALAEIRRHLDEEGVLGRDLPGGAREWTR